MILEKIGENIRVFRTLKRYSQHGLARKINKGQSWLQQLEKGEIDISISNLKELADELGVTIEKILSFSPKNIFNQCQYINGGNNQINIISGDELVKVLEENKKTIHSNKL